jgi:hypothetical protein
VEEAFERGNMKMRTIKLNPKYLLEALQGKTACFATNLPEDAQLLDLRFDLCTNQVFAVIRSDSFEDIAELYPIPEFEITFASTFKTAPQPAPRLKLEPTPLTVSKPEPAPPKKTHVQPSRYTSRIEDEFTPEQQKLLSFRVDGDCVIVKPIQFLKAEWDDINDTVRSLGGKWVKGDIISYWAIPLP